jgi:hypothetical protein
MKTFGKPQILKKIISGGQTGADLAVLDVAIRLKNLQGIGAHEGCRHTGRQALSSHRPELFQFH